ncbi:MAG TPA: STAS/SEC14 domain-containing protein [Nannocystis exedens]|nr:STAS/SEC14 domain-containing protein [Nannocystis exedens]
MLQIISDLPDNVIAVTATGMVTANDDETVLIPAIEQAHRQYGKIRMLYRFETTLGDYTAGALWDDAKVGLKHLTHFEKFALVTDNHVIAASTKALGFLIPGEVRVFALSELATATTWISE